jgi:hypothetical protein
MSFEPNEADHLALDRFLELVLDIYKDGRADRDTAVGILAHVMTAAAIDNAAEFKAHIRLSETQLLSAA